MRQARSTIVAMTKPVAPSEAKATSTRLFARIQRTNESRLPTTMNSPMKKYRLHKPVYRISQTPTHTDERTENTQASEN